MRSTRSMLARVVVVAVTGVVVAGCATSPSAYRNRDEPINRTTASDPYRGEPSRGTVVRVDEPQRVVVLDDGRMYRVPGEQTVMVNGQPVVLGRVQPGTPVTIVGGTPVVYRNGQYVAVEPGATTVVAAPPGTVVAAPAQGRIVRLYGQVTDVEGNGNVKVRLPGGEDIEFRPPAGIVAREGDPVTIDMTFGAPAPSALPR